MGTRRTAWHLFFGRLLIERGAPGIEVRPEVPLGTEPQRADFLLLRRVDRIHRDGEAQVLRGLWAHLAQETLMEFKSVPRPFASRDLERLLAYGLQWWVASSPRLATHADLTLVLVVAARSQLLDRAVEALHWRWRELGKGYHQLEGGPFVTLVVELDVVAAAEQDELVGTFGHQVPKSGGTRRWWLAHKGMEGTNVRPEDMDDYDDIARKFAESIPVEYRLAGLSTEQQWLALSDEALRALPSAFIETLPASVRQRIRERIGG